MALLEHARERYLRTPRLEAAEDGGAILHVIAWEPEGERLLAFPLDADGVVTADPRPGRRAETIVALRPGVPPEPTDDPAVEDMDVRDGWSARIDREQGVSTVVVTRPGGGETVAWRARGTAAAPALGPTEDGAWLAFHHDVREDTGEPDLAKWIALRFVDRDGGVHEPTAEMTDRDRDREGVEQSFELPSLAVGSDGAVALFGRGSHNFWRQDLTAEGFAPRQPMSDGEWGCRGRHVSVLQMPDGSLLVARRERKGIEVERQPGPRGGRPALRPVAAPAAPAAAAPTARDRADDPASQDGRRTLFGDIHQHSAHSDGIGTADECYLRARWMYGDDFCALTDHESFLGKRIGPGEWRYLESVAERHHAPGTFATLFAYEWTAKRYPGPGHKVVYWPDGGHPVLSRDDLPEGRALVEAVAARGGFAVPHHVGWTGADAPGHDPVGQPVWEICSCHGCYEHPDHPLGQRGEHYDQLVQTMLRAGLRFGFIACSDSHGLVRHHGIARKRDPFRTGLTAVQATATTREAIFAAIRERRCYATSGAKILLDLRAGEVPMGGVVRGGGPIAVRSTALGDGPIERLELVGPEGPLAETRPDGARATLQADVAAPWVYARCVQRDGEMAWSSPIFVES